jgi:hypothetical protein
MGFVATGNLEQQTVVQIRNGKDSDELGGRGDDGGLRNGGVGVRGGGDSDFGGDMEIPTPTRARARFG